MHHIFKVLIVVSSSFIITSTLSSCKSVEQGHIDRIVSEDISDIEMRSAEFVGGPEAFYSVLRYPDNARQRRAQGNVILAYKVNEFGILESVEIETSSGNSDLDRAAVTAFEQLRFIPTVHDGERVSMSGFYPVIFRMN